MAEPADINVDELRRRARRRLVGAVVLALAVAVIVPMLLETDQKPLGEDVSVKIPPIDDGKFVNRLNQSPPKDAAQGGDAAKAPAPDAAQQAPAAAAERTSKYDTRIPEAAGGDASAAAPPTSAGAAAASAAPDEKPSAAPTEAHAPEAAPPAASRAPASAETAKPATAPTNAHASAAKAAPPASAHDGFAVQLAAFADDKGADALAGRLKKAGYAAYTEPLKTSKGTLWRVRVGPYSSREAAVAARDKLKTQGQSGIVAAVK